ncbi:MAG: nucleotide pyrophosphohydrolase [Candidatus Moranbacteria bacterium]|nr:nucleotide pyrophosphohydrolase [Candidatus Moranbacteria bacterium]
MDKIKDLTKRILAFRNARDWKQFHNPKDVALSLVLEAAEVMEHFQWKNPAEIEEYVKKHKKDIGEELADVFNWVLLLSHDLGIDIVEAAKKKVKKNEKKYPVEKAKGRHDKYTEQ